MNKRLNLPPTYCDRGGANDRADERRIIAKALRAYAKRLRWRAEVPDPHNAWANCSDALASEIDPEGG